MASANSLNIAGGFTSKNSAKKQIVKVKNVLKDILKSANSLIHTKDANSETIVPLNTVKIYKEEKSKT